MRQTLLLGGVKPGTDADRKQRRLRLFSDLDTAIGKAEDLLLASEALECDPHQSASLRPRDGFRQCLRLIDEQVSW